MIFPVPVKEEYFDGKYKLKEKYDTAVLFEFYKSTENGTNDIKLKENVLLKKEEYSIKINENGICVEFSCDEGKFRALTSVRQLIVIEGEELSYADISDFPQFEHRSYMLDISRDRIPKPEKIMHIIDYLAELKYNEFQLYMENFCFKYSAYPDYTKNFDCLTPDDIVMLDKYCKERFIELVPNQNSFGHMDTWLGQDELKILEVTDGKAKTGTVNPLMNETKELIDNIYGSLLPYFSSGRVNIGLDEAYGLGKYQLEEICNEKGKANVFMDYLCYLSELAEKKYGKTVMFWDDMVINYPESFHRVPKNAVALEWGYDLIQSQMMGENCKSLADKGVRFYVCPGTNVCLSFTGRFDIASFNLRTAAELGQKHGAEGYMVTDWGNNGNPQFFVWSYVPLALAGQYAWNVGIKQHGGWLKAWYIHAAEEFADRFLFKAKVSRELYRMASYYLLEPERLHGTTVCAHIFLNPLDKDDYGDFFKFSEIADPIYFEEIITRMKTEQKRIKKLDFAEDLKSEILCNSDIVILCSEYALVKIAGKVSEEKYDELTAYSEKIEKDFTRLWLNKDFEEGINTSLSNIRNRRQELKSFVK